VRRPTHFAVGVEAVEARGVDQDSKTFKTTVRFMAAMNTLPKTADLTDGYFRRIAIVTFNRQYRGEQVNPNLSRGGDCRTAGYSGVGH